MKQIWEFPIARTEEQVIEMPMGWGALDIQTQNGHPYLWAIVDPSAKKSKCKFHVIRTGWPFDNDGLTYLGTWQDSGGTYVWHLFYEWNP
jgi:hypothetical protein